MAEGSLFGWTLCPVVHFVVVFCLRLSGPRGDCPGSRAARLPGIYGCELMKVNDLNIASHSHMQLLEFILFIQGHSHRKQRGVTAQGTESLRWARPGKHRLHPGQSGLLHRTLSRRGETTVFVSDFVGRFCSLLLTVNNWHESSVTLTASVWRTHVFLL